MGYFSQFGFWTQIQPDSTRFIPDPRSGMEEEIVTKVQRSLVTTVTAAAAAEAAAVNRVLSCPIDDDS